MADLRIDSSRTLGHKRNLALHYVYPSTDDEEEYVQADPEHLDELDRYLALPVAPKGTDALAWWKAHERLFPNLAKMARQFLGSPASTAAIERLFSHCSNMHSDLRKQLKDGTFTDAMFAQNAD